MNELIEPISPYTWPSVLVTQLFDGELSMKSWHPGKMTISERDRWQSRLKEKWGGNIVTDTIVDVATDPWVWLMVLTSGFFKVPTPGSLFKTVGQVADPFLKENRSILRSLGLLHGSRMLRGTPLEPLMWQIASNVKNYGDDAKRAIAPAYEEFLKASGFGKNVSSDNPQWQQAMRLMWARLNGWDEAASYQRGDLFFDKATKKWSLKVKGKGRGAILDKAALDADMDAIPGLRKFTEGVRQFLDNQYNEQFGKLVNGKWEVDPEKVLRQWRGTRHPVMNVGMRKGGARNVQQFFDAKIQKAIEKGELSYEDFLGLVKQNFELKTQGVKYFPRNTLTTILGGRTVSGTTGRSVRETSQLRQAGASVSRDAGERVVMPKDLEALQHLVKTPEQAEVFGGLMKQSEARMVRSLDRPTKFMEMDPIKGLVNHMRQTAFNRALYVDAPDEWVLRSQKEIYPVFRKRVQEPGFENTLAHMKAHGLRSADGKFIPMDTVMEGGGAGAPMGGWSVADALEAGHHMMHNDRHAQRFLTEVLVPQMQGTMEPRAGVMRAVLQHGQAAMAATLKGPIGNALRANPSTKSLAERMKQWTDVEITPLAADKATNALANYLYVSHLGMPNLGSPLLNMFQPFITVGRIIPPQELVPLYASAVADATADLTKYTLERAKQMRQGLWTLTRDQKQELLERTITGASKKYGNAANISDPILEELDRIAFRGSKLMEKGGTWSRVEDWLMAIFEKSEHFNRNTTFHLMKKWHEKHGMPVGHQGFVREARTVVNETQFGGDILNTPEIFLRDQSIFNNRLVRQFMQFPVRMLTGAFDTIPRSVEGVSYGAGLTRDIIRGMGWSALAYHVIRNTTGGDPSRGLYAESVTDFVTRPSERMMPPIVSIPKNITMGFLEQDMQAVRNEFPRLVPGGIGLSKWASVMPSLKGAGVPPPLHWLQKQYVRWDLRDPEGNVAVVDASGERVISYESPTMMLARQAGLDPLLINRAGSQREVETFLLKQREMISEYRMRYLVALESGDFLKAQSIESEFKKRFKMDLRISRAQIKAFQEARTVSRPERILNRLPAELRQQVTPAVSQVLGGRLGVPKETFDEFQTTTQRNAARALSYEGLPPEVGFAIQRTAADQQAEAARYAFQVYGE